jgi:hypothetical protein
VSRYCLAHAPCPVLALPPTRPRPARLGIPPPRARPPDQPGVVGLTGQGHRTSQLQLELQRSKGHSRASVKTSM